MYAKYMNKKGWHPGSMKNIQQVCLVEQKQKELEIKANERLKKLKEEREMEKYKQELEKQGLNEGNQQKMSWMY